LVSDNSSKPKLLNENASLDKLAVFANGRAQRRKISAWACGRWPDSPFFFESRSAVSPWRGGPLNGRKQGGKPKCPGDTNITTFFRTLGSISCTKKNPSSLNNARENRRYIPRTHVVPGPRPVPPGGNRSLRQVNMPSEPAPNSLYSSMNRMGPSSLPKPVLQTESRADEWRGGAFRTRRLDHDI
jgi:hypothetical protein